MNRDELRALLQSPYDRARWLAALPALLPAVQVFARPQPLDIPDDVVREAFQLARIPLADDRSVAVIEVRVSGQVDLQRNRAGLRNLVARFMGSPSADAILAFFVGDAPDYRFSFAARTHAFSSEGQLQRHETAPRRFTYILGPSLPCRTALERLEWLRARGARARLDDLVEAFRVEPLFDEFYADYRRVFAAVEDQLRPGLPDPETLRLFAQRLFNRLMFLAFVERKGWLRLGQRTDYLAALWADYIVRRNPGKASPGFYRERLVPLFFEGLNQPDRPPDFTDPRFGSVPYLNGGLFEYAEDGTDRLPALRVPDEAIALILDPEVGLFSRYNFTVAESTPLEVHVAVDPEMLGKVFEELVTGRHEQGSYYTPKPIVSFMGRAALVEHLVDRCPAESRPAIERFVHDEDGSALRDPESIHGALTQVTICDPACGSGAYLLGLLHELLELRSRLFAARPTDPESAYQRRLQIIERNLYGVDKDPFAINIARLRLWLALAVEFEGPVPPPLPNLDFKIEVGDALAAPAPVDLFQRTAVLDFRDKKAAFLRAHGPEKARFKAELDAIRKDLALWQEVDLAGHGFNWAVEFAEVFLPNPNDRALLADLGLKDQPHNPIRLGGFDIIVANPPYVRMELIKPQKPILRKRFPSVHAERADLYIYFYARAHELLRPGGTAAFISSNKWLRAGYGEGIRRNLLDSQAFRLVMDFGSLPVFKSATAYPCVYIWQRKPRGDLETKWATVRDLDVCYSQGVRRHFDSIAEVVPATSFGPDKPRLATAAVAQFKSRLSTTGLTLGELVGGKLAWGIKTGFNEAFFLNRQQYEAILRDNPEAKEIIKPLVVGEDIRRYEIHDRSSFLIYTYHGVDMARYDAVLRHLKPFRHRLEQRATIQQWYELQQPQMAYRSIYEGPKISYPIIASSLRFCRDDFGFLHNDKAFSIPVADWFVLAVLNSTTVWQWMQQTLSPLRGGYFEFRAQYLEQLPIPDASVADREVVGGLARRAQGLHGERRERSEAFLRGLGLDPAGSTSRNPLEQPWTLDREEYAKRVRKLLGRGPDMGMYESARAETAALTEEIARVEAEIDARVAALYGLDAEDQRWAAKASPADAKQTLFFEVLGRLKAGHAYFPVTEIHAAVQDAELSLTEESLRVYLSEATQSGVIHDAGRGWYSRLSEPLRLDPKPVQKLIRATRKALPLLDFCAWSTAQINPWLTHLLAQPVAFLYVPRETLESVGETLRAEGWDVWVHPGKNAAQEVRPGEKSVVLRPTHSKQPPAREHVAAPEQVWVEWMIEVEALALMDDAEASAALHAAVESGLVQMAEMKRFAEAKYLKWSDLWPVNQRHNSVK